MKLGRYRLDSGGRRWTSRIRIAVVVSVTVVFLLQVALDAARSRHLIRSGSAAGASHPSATLIDKSSELQRERKAWIQKLVDTEVFSTVRLSNGIAEVHALQAFHDRSFAEQQEAVAVVYAYYFDGSRPEDHVCVLEAATQVEIGRYTIADGLKPASLTVAALASRR